MIDLETLGITKEELTERLLNTLVDRFLYTETQDEDGIPQRYRSQIEATMQKRVIEHIDTALATKFETAGLTDYVRDLVSNFTIAETNSYGEVKRPAMTITEYVVYKVDVYFREMVDHTGLTSEEARKKGSSNWGSSRKIPRVEYLIDYRLNEEIDKALKQSLTDANALIVNGLKAAVVHQLGELNKKLNPGAAK